MHIKSIELTTHYIEHVPSAQWPLRCTIKLGDDDPDYSWRQMEHQLTPEETKAVCEMISKIVFTKPDMSRLVFHDPSPAQIEIWKQEKEEADRPQYTPEEEAAYSAAEAEAWLTPSEPDSADDFKPEPRV